MEDLLYGGDTVLLISRSIMNSYILILWKVDLRYMGSHGSPDKHCMRFGETVCTSFLH